MLSSSSMLAVLIAVLKTPTASAQSPFQPPTECGPITTVSTQGIPEAQGRSADLTVWALFFLRPFEAHKDVKIVWRVTGTGSFQVRGYQPLGATALPTWVQQHGGSNWEKPGDEWGTGFNFPSASAGCWDLHITRGKSSGDLWIEVK